MFVPIDEIVVSEDNCDARTPLGPTYQRVGLVFERDLLCLSFLNYHPFFLFLPVGSLRPKRVIEHGPTSLHPQGKSLKHLCFISSPQAHEQFFSPYRLPVKSLLRSISALCKFAWTMARLCDLRFTPL